MPPDAVRLEEWRPRLHHLLAGEEIVTAAAQGTDAPGFARSWPTTPDILVLRALAFDNELRRGMTEAGLAQTPSVLDAGCGPGMITRLLAEISGGHVLGIDREPELLTFTQSLPQPTLGMQHALVEGSRRCFGTADDSDGTLSKRSELARAGPWRSQRAFSVLIERFSPVPAVFEEVERQIFGRYTG